MRCKNCCREDSKHEAVHCVPALEKDHITASDLFKGYLEDIREAKRQQWFYIGLYSALYGFLITNADVFARTRQPLLFFLILLVNLAVSTPDYFCPGAPGYF